VRCFESSRVGQTLQVGGAPAAAAMAAEEQRAIAALLRRLDGSMSQGSPSTFEPLAVRARRA
jgi:hypothetical protein